MTTRRKLGNALDYGRTIQSIHELQDAGSIAAPEDILAILDVSEVDADAQPKKITIQDLITAGGGGVPAGGTTGQVLGKASDTDYDTEWVDQTGGGGTPGGSDTQVQFNDGGAFGGDAGLTYDKTTNELTVGTVAEGGSAKVHGDINLDDGGSFLTTVQCVTPTADRFISFPDDTGIVSLVRGSNGSVQFNNAGYSGGGNLHYDSTGGTFGYGAGGGSITQATNKSTAVVLDKATGQITMNAAALAADTTVTFTLTNSSIRAGDLLVLNHISGGTAGSYLLNAQCAAGSASINVRNVTAASLSEAIVIGFAVIKSTTV